MCDLSNTTGWSSAMVAALVPVGGVNTINDDDG